MYRTVRNVKILIYILCDNFLTVWDKKIVVSNKFLKKREGTMVKISAQLEHVSDLVLNVLNILSVIVNFGFLTLYLDTWIQTQIEEVRIQPDPDTDLDPKHWCEGNFAV